MLADAFGVGLDTVKIMATTTARYPTPLRPPLRRSDPMAWLPIDAARQIKERLTRHAAKLHNVGEAEVQWVQGASRPVPRFVPFAELAASAYLNRVQLSAAVSTRHPGFTGGRRATGRGHPFYYFAYGASSAKSPSIR